MTLRNFKITNLYHFYSYEITFENRNGEPFIITGVNGTGKTTIFRILNSIAALDLEYFLTIPFEKIELYFDNNTFLVITQDKKKIDSNNNGDREISKEYEVAFELKDETKTLNNFRFDKNDIFKARTFLRIASLPKTFDVPIASIIERVANDKNQSQLLMILRSLKVTFIEAQRVNKKNKNFDNEANGFIINDIANDLQNQLKTAGNSYLQKANRIDSVFIDRLLDAPVHLSKEQYENKADSIQSKLNKLKDFGFEGNVRIREYNDENSSILATYVDGIEEKIAAYDDILGKLELFKELLDTKRFMHKKVSFSQTAGIKVTTDDGFMLDLGSLSSGEQNEIIMLYYMIFTLQDNSILLIDEPEISLHVAWQVNCIAEIKKIAELKNVQVIIATHSPQIINDNWNNCYDLGQNNLNEIQ